MNISSFCSDGYSQSTGVNNSGDSNPGQNLLASVPDLKRLRSALLFTPPTGSVSEIAYHFIMPMVKAAREFPEVTSDIKVLACVWACGSLHPDLHPGLMAITRQGKTGAALFEAIWSQLYNDTSYTGKTRSLGSIYFLAKKAGWAYSTGGEHF